jgi:hypothetical protein
MTTTENTTNTENIASATSTENTTVNSTSTTHKVPVEEEEDQELHGWYIRDTFDMKSYLKHRLRGQLVYFNKKSSEEKQKFIKYQWTLIIGSALTPVLVAATNASMGDADFTAFFQGFMYWATMLVSMVVGIMASALKTFKYQENWASTRAVCEMINREKFLYEACVGEYSDKSKRDGIFVERVEGLLAREQNQWLNSAAQVSNSKQKDEDGDGIPDEVDEEVTPKDKKVVPPSLH